MNAIDRPLECAIAEIFTYHVRGPSYTVSFCCSQKKSYCTAMGVVCSWSNKVSKSNFHCTIQFFQILIMSHFFGNKKLQMPKCMPRIPLKSTSDNLHMSGRKFSMPLSYILLVLGSNCRIFEHTAKFWPSNSESECQKKPRILPNLEFPMILWFFLNATCSTNLMHSELITAHDFLFHHTCKKSVELYERLNFNRF